MISFLTGKPGGGKGLLAMQQIIDELVKGTRPIITNLAVRVLPWVGPDWKPMIGLQQYLLKKYKKDFDVLKRVFVLDSEQAGEFFLWRVIDGVLVKAEGVYKGEKLMSFDASLAERSGPVLYCIDEAWKFWNSRNWQRTGEGMMFYTAQHRHLGDDVLICTQHTKQIDPAIQRCAQDFWVVRNHGKMTFGMFRQPAVFSVCIYDQAPTGASIDPMSRKMFTLDRAGLAQTYDTSAGVGLSGRLMADVGRGAKGMPWWLMIVAVFAILIGIWYAIRFGAHAVTHGMVKGSKTITQKAGIGAGAVSGGGVVSGQGTVGLNAEAGLQATNEVVVCRGFTILPRNRVLVFMSDGRVADSADGEVQRIFKRRVEVFGEKFELVRIREADLISGDSGVAPESMRGFSVRMPAKSVAGEETPVVGVIPGRSVLPGASERRRSTVQGRMQADTLNQ